MKQLPSVKNFLKQQEKQKKTLAKYKKSPEVVTSGGESFAMSPWGSKVSLQPYSQINKNGSQLRVKFKD